MATSRGQRIGIWIIAGVLAVGTLGGFVAMILSTENDRKDAAEQQKIYAEYQKQLEEQQKKLQAEADELSGQYYEGFKQYESAPTAFDMNAVGSTVTKNDLEVGTGDEITKDTKYKAYYIGWNPKGKTFDSSFDGAKLKAPIDTSTTTLIEGWNEGVVGMKVGGVREITIPSDLAYKETGAGDDIPPNTPIKFIVKIIQTV